MIIDDILQIAPPGTEIPKPEAKGKFLVKGQGKRRGERAIVYTIPGSDDPEKHYEKGLTETELEEAHDELISSGTLTKQ